MENLYLEFKSLLFELPAVAENKGELAAFEMLDNSLKHLASIRNELSTKQDKAEMKHFRDICLETLLQSTFGKYVFEKPRGYSGDFVTQEMIWRGRTDPNRHRYLGATSIGKILTALTYDMGNPRANEERIYILKRHIAESKSKIASIGCGSCIELWNAEEELKRHEFFLLDQDEGALQRAQEEISLDNVTYHREDIVKFILRNNRQNILSGCSFVYAFGLFDYLNMGTARKLTNYLWKCVSPSGTLLITNAHPANPTRLWMEWAGDWFMDYKNTDTMFGLAEDLQDIAAVKLTNDSFGVYQYLEIRKS